MSGYTPTDQQFVDMGLELAALDEERSEHDMSAYWMVQPFSNSSAFRAIIRAAQAEAWDEGYGDDLEATTPRTNPYRQENA